MGRMWYEMIIGEDSTMSIVQDKHEKWLRKSMRWERNIRIWEYVKRKNSWVSYKKEDIRFIEYCKEGKRMLEYDNMKPDRI